MFKPAQLLALSAIAVGAIYVYGVPSSVIGGPRTVNPVSAVLAAQTALAVASLRQRTTSECGLQGARDRARAVSC